MEIKSDKFGDGLLPECRKVSAGSDQDDGANQGNKHDPNGERQFDISKIDIREQRGKDDEQAEKAIEFTDHGFYYNVGNLYPIHS